MKRIKLKFLLVSLALAECPREIETQLHDKITASLAWYEARFGSKFFSLRKQILFIKCDFLVKCLNLVTGF